MRRYPLDQLEIVNAEVDAADGTITYRGEDDGSVFIHIRNIDTVIGSVYMDMTIPDDVLEYVVCYTDEANSSFYRSFNR